jgi:ATP-dependent protease ClpP protease subunit
MVFEVSGKINKELVLLIYNEVELATQKPNEVELIIDSKGGDAQYGIFLYEYLRNIGKRGIETKATVLSKCCSAALLVFCGANKRVAYPSSEFLMHQTRTALQEDTLEELQSTLDSYKVYEDMSYKILSESSIRAEIIWREKCRGEHYFNGSEAYTIGLVTELLGEINETEQKN